MKKLVKWVEIPAADFDRAVKFYEEILEIKLEKIDSFALRTAVLEHGCLHRLWGELHSADCPRRINRTNSP